MDTIDGAVVVTISEVVFADDKLLRKPEEEELFEAREFEDVDECAMASADELRCNLLLMRSARVSLLLLLLVVVASCAGGSC